MQIVITIAIIALMVLVVVFGLLSVMRDLLDRFVEWPLMSQDNAGLRDKLPAALAKTPIVDGRTRLRTRGAGAQ
jgi:hypothetical protein